MGLIKNLLTTEGRHGRLKYLFVSLLGCFLYSVLDYFLKEAFGGKPVSDYFLKEVFAGKMISLYTIGHGCLYIAYVYAFFCNAAKRFHDLNKSTWWAVAFSFIPILLGLYNRRLGVITIILLNIYPQFFKGTEGPNQYGDEP